MRLPKVPNVEGAKAFSKRQREQGYRDGYAGRVARSPLLLYQRSYLLGRKARVQDEREAAS